MHPALRFATRARTFSRKFSSAHAYRRSSNKGSFSTEQNRLMGGLTAVVLGATAVALAEAKPEDVVPPGPGGLPEDEPQYLQRRKKKSGTSLPNPGRFENYQKECREVLSPDIFSGARFEMSYGLMQRMEKQFALTFSASMDQESNPETGKSVELGAQVASQDDLLWARVDDQFRGMGRYHKQLTSNLLMKSMFQAGDEFNWMADFDYEGSDYFGHFKYSNSSHGTMLCLSYLQSITQSMCLGVEGMHQIGAGTHVSFVGRYADLYNQKEEGDIWTAQLSSTMMAGLSYARKLNSSLTLANEINFQLVPRETGVEIAHVVQMGAIYKYQSFRFLTNFTTEGVIQANLEQQLQPNVALCLSSELNHWTLDSKLGLAFRIG